MADIQGFTQAQQAPLTYMTSAGMVPMSGGDTDYIPGGDMGYMDVNSPDQSPQPQNNNLEPVPFPGPQDPGQFLQNARVDGSNMIQGIFTLGAAGMNRVAETLPQDILNGKAFEPDYQAQPDWYFGNSSYGSKAPIRPEDGPLMQNMAGQIINDYNTKYIQPALRGDIGAIGQEFLNKPVSTYFDLSPVPGVAKGIARRIPYSGELIDAAGKIIERVPVASKVQQIFRDHKLNIEQQSEFARGAATQDYNYSNKMGRMNDMLTKAEKAIPQRLQDQLIAGAERSDQAAIRAVDKNQAARRFLRLADKLNTQSAAGLKKWGYMTEEAEEAARYGPSTGLGADALRTPMGQELLDITRKGSPHEPTYVGRVPEWEVRKTALRAGSMFSATKNTKTLAAGIAMDNRLVANLPGWLRERIRDIRGDMFTKSAKDSIMTRLIQAHKTIALTEFFDWVLKNPKLAGNTPYSAKNFFVKLGEMEGVSQAEIIAFMKANKVPEMVNLPAKIAEKLARIEKGLGSTAGRDNIVIRVLERAATTQKGGQLGFNIGWALWQTAQNGTIYGLATFRGPQDIAPSIMAMALAHDKDIVKALPRQWVSDLSEGAVREAGTLGKIFAPVLAIPKVVFKTASLGDNYWRTAYGIKKMMEQANKLPPASRSLMKEAFSLQANKCNVLALSKNPAALYEAGLAINRWFGRYDTLFNDEQWLLRMIYPYTNWYIQSFTILKALPNEVPFKTATMAQMVKHAPAIFQDENVLTESELRSGSVVSSRLGPNGNPVIMNGNQLALPQATALEILKQILSAPDELTTFKAQSLLMNALLQLPIMMMTNTDSSGRDFSSPELIKVKGMTFDKTGKRIQGYKPSLPHLAFRALAPVTERQIREARAEPYKPSDATSVFNSNPLPRRQFRGGAPVKNEPLLQRMIGDLTKLRGHEQSITKAEETQMKQYEQKEFRRAFGRQQSKLDPVDALPDKMVKDILQGKVTVWDDGD